MLLSTVEEEEGGVVDFEDSIFFRAMGGHARPVRGLCLKKNAVVPAKSSPARLAATSQPETTMLISDF